MTEQAAFKSITVRDDGVVWKGQTYSFERALTLYYFATHTIVKDGVIGFIPVIGTRAETHDAQLKLFLSDNVTIKEQAGSKIPAIGTLREAAGLFSPNSGIDPKKACAMLFDVYLALAERTFSYRLRKYVDEVETKGYFTYDKVKFFKDGLVFNGKKERNIKTDELRHSSFAFAVDKHPHQRTLRDKWSGAEIAVSLLHDRDVFFALLRELYGKSTDDMVTIRG